MVTVARNWVRDQARRRAARFAIEALYTFPEPVTNNSELSEELRAAMSVLAAEHREAVELYLASYTPQQAAEYSEIPITRAWSRRHQAFGALGNELIRSGAVVTADTR
jgi:DNA-directed RNA polymerase specialized sigma24 family protein